MNLPNRNYKVSDIAQPFPSLVPPGKKGVSLPRAARRSKPCQEILRKLKHSTAEDLSLLS